MRCKYVLFFRSEFSRHPRVGAFWVWVFETPKGLSFSGLSFRDTWGSEFFESAFLRHLRVWVFRVWVFETPEGLSFSSLSFWDTWGSEFFGSEFSRHPRVWVFWVWGLSFQGLSFRDTLDEEQHEHESWLCLNKQQHRWHKIKITQLIWKRPI